MKGKFGKKSKDLMWDLALEMDRECSSASESCLYVDATEERDESVTSRDVSLRANTFRLLVFWDAPGNFWGCVYAHTEQRWRKKMPRYYSSQPRLRDALRDMIEQARGSGVD
jgi:hypothetical protein